VNATVKEGESYTVPAGYHNGSGTVTGVAGGGNYKLQTKSVTPTTQQQSVTPDSGYYGLSGVTVASIPEAYQDVTSVTASAGDVLANKVIVTSTGAVVAGTMPNNGAISRTLNTNTPSVTVPAGYHNGSGTVSITLESKEATPTKEQQVIAPSTGKVLSDVLVNPIPDEYQDVSAVTADSNAVLEGYDIVDANGDIVSGAIPVIQSESATLNVATDTYQIETGYHDGLGSVTVAYSEIDASNPVIPSTEPQVITDADGGFLSSVYVDAIPSNYIDTSDATAAAADIINGKSAYVDGSLVFGTMPNATTDIVLFPNPITIGQETVAARTSEIISQGYHDGTGIARIIVEPATATPTKQTQTIYPSDGHTLSYVTVNPIPANYIDTSDATAKASDILEGTTAYINGQLVTGTMENNGATALTMDGLTTTSVTIAAGYTSGGTVSLTDDIEQALAAI